MPGLASGGGVGTNMGAGAQIIGGKEYQIYSPQWYDAMNADKIKSAGVTGTATGTEKQASLDAQPSLKGLLTGAGGGGLFGGDSGVTGVLPPSGGGTGTPTTPPLVGNDYGNFGGGSGGGGGGSSAPAMPTLQMPDQSAATAAAFAHAKDQAGQMTRASLDSLAGELGGQGMLGSGAQLKGAAGILAKGTNLLGEESRMEAQKSADIAADFAKTGYEGSITQRGQDIGQQTAYRGQDIGRSTSARGQDIEQRGQDIQSQEAQATLANAQYQAEAQRNLQRLQMVLGGLSGAGNLY